MRSEFPEHILSSLRQRKLSAFEHVYNHSRIWLFTTALAIVQDEAAAQDIVQELFIDLWEKELYTHAETSLKGYLLRSVKNRSLNHLKKREIRNKVRSLPEFALKFFVPTLKMEQEQLRATLEKAMKMVPKACAEAFTLHYIEGMQHTDIAKIQGVSRFTVRNQISQALRILRKELKNIQNS